MHAPTTAKHRARRRARDTGAVVLIVAMALAVLATMGVYALRASQLDLATAGSARQRLQTHYLDEYALIALSQHLSSDIAGDYLDHFDKYNDQTRTDADQHTSTGCSSTSAVPNDPANPATQTPDVRRARWCWRLTSQALGYFFRASDGTPRTPLVSWDGGYQPGSFGVGQPGSAGDPAVSMGGDFLVELTDPEEGPPIAGFKNRCYVYFTATAVAATMPRGVSDAGILAGMGMESARARLRAGPITCRKSGSNGNNGTADK